MEPIDSIDWSNPLGVFEALQGPSSNIPIPKLISPGSVHKEARERSKNIFADWELMKGILDRHESTIRKRWLKKTKSQRVEILTAAWPKMSASHRPDFVALRRESERERKAGTNFRQAYLWPHVNLEDLTMTKTLPLFLSARARNTPDVFAWVDQDAPHLGLVSQAIVPPFLNEYTMMLTNRKTSKTYGELVSWDDDDRAFMWMMTGYGMHPGQGLLVLEIQEKIYRFLVDCSMRIMHDIPVEQIASSSYPIGTPLEPLLEKVDGFDSLVVMRTDAPYRAPTSMDLARLESLFTARKHAAEDHIWAMREDPGYFAAKLLEFRDHRQETMKDTTGRSHPLVAPAREMLLWYRIIGNVVGGAQLQLEMWSELLVQTKELRRLQSKHASSISEDEDLPEEFLGALLKFRHYMNQAAKGAKSTLKHLGAASPPLRQFFDRLPPKDPDSPIIQLVSNRNVKPTKLESQLLWLLEVLWTDGDQLFLLDMINAVDELERLIQSDMEVKSLISPYLADVLSDLSVQTEALRQLKMYQPWAQTFENAMADREEDIKSQFAKGIQTWGLVMAVLNGPDQARITQLGVPDGKFFYPIDKRRTKEHVQAMRLAEKNLDAFWLAVDKNMRSQMGSQLEKTALWKLLSQSRDLERTPEWVDPQKARKSAENAETLLKPLSELYFDRQLRTERTVDHSLPKTKTTKEKTRGAARSPTSLDTVPPGEQQDFQPTFHLDPRALKVFRTLFYTPSISATPGEVPWNDFLHAMVSVGFIPEKLYGSVWQFKPTKLDLERSIQFHEPHPVGKIEYWKARRIGRRLNHAYGWNGAMFVPKATLSDKTNT